MSAYPVSFDRLPLTTARVGVLPGRAIVMKPRSVGISWQSVVLMKARQKGMTALRNEVMKRRGLL